MKPGQTIEFLRDNENPLHSRNTRTVAAAVSCGCKPAEKAYSYTVEETKNGLQRTVTWIMDGDAKAVFEPAFEREELTFSEVAKRFADRDWCEANANHPIAYLRAFSDNLAQLTAFVKEHKPSVLIRRGNRVATIAADATEETRARILAML
jgi:hypothetical protein